MHKGKSKKLVVRSETLRNLSAPEMKKVVGGLAVLGQARSINGACANEGPLK